MGPVLKPQTLERFLSRCAAVRDPAQRRWGRLGPAGLLAHLRFSVDLSLERVSSPDISTIWTRSVVRAMAFYVMPAWPRGKLVAPPEFCPDPADLEAERTALGESIRNFVDRASAEPGHVVCHPLFGPLKLRFWQRVHGRHMDHHLKQFGV